MERQRWRCGLLLGLGLAAACTDWQNEVYLRRPSVLEPAARRPWPTTDKVSLADTHDEFANNVSGLFFEAATDDHADTLWAVRNAPSMLYRLVPTDAIWRSLPSAPWTRGLLLRYPSGTGSPDAEGVTKASVEEPFIYVSAERNNTSPNHSRQSVLRYDTSSSNPGIATHEWNLTADLPSAPPNTGIESIAWVPDTFLTAKGFIDESRELPYDPALYPNHGAGVFIVGEEGTGLLFAYTLDHENGSYQRVASFDSRNAGVMDLSFDRENGLLWALCDNHCDNALSVLDIDTEPTSSRFGRFYVRAGFSPPSTMPNYNNEGIALAPESECVEGKKPMYWTDDSNDHGHSLRTCTVPCGDFL